MNQPLTTPRVFGGQPALQGFRWFVLAPRLTRKPIWITRIDGALAYRTDDMPNGEWNEITWLHRTVWRYSWIGPSDF